MKDGGPAFPAQHPALDPRASGFHTESGMTLRDYFAAKAMERLIELQPSEEIKYDEFLEETEQVAHLAYLYADAMIAESNKGAA